jgi:hypothetical protein
VVIGRAGDTSGGPEIALPFVELVVTGASVEEQDTRGTINQPSSIQGLDAPVVHALDCSDQRRISRLHLFHLNRGRGAVQGTDQGVAGAILGGGDLSFRLEHTVDSSDSVGDFGSDLEQDVVVDVPLGKLAHDGRCG